MSIALPVHQQTSIRQHFSNHDRSWHDFRYVYPVISRRSRGMSVGLSLFDIKVCNFDCVYCQAGRGCASKVPPIDLSRMTDELHAMLDAICSGRIWQDPKFADVTGRYRRINDIAFSGNGEPTGSRQFANVARIAAAAKERFELHDVKLVLITNASLLHLPHAQQGLKVMDKHNSEVWAKLDVGTPAGFSQINRSATNYDHLLNNIHDCAKRRPVVIQTMLMKTHGKTISRNRFKAYAHRIKEMLDDDCQIDRVQLYTVARKPAEDYVSPMSDEEMRRYAQQLHRAVPSVKVEVFGGVDGD